MAKGRIVVANWGSSGDLHPHLALALGLRDRGHDVVLAAAPPFRGAVERVGVPFHPMRPDVPERAGNEALFAKMMDPRHGTEFIMRCFVVPAIRQSYADIEAVAAEADLLVTGALAFGAALVAERNGIPWAATALQPSALFSAYDPPSWNILPGVEALRRLPPWAVTPLKEAVGRATDRWFAPIARFRGELGLPPARVNPFAGGASSPWLNLALFSPVIGSPQPDWPPRTAIVGFPFDPRVDGSSLPADLDRFLAAGEPPVVFTLGSAAVYAPGGFWRESIAVVRALRRRAVLLVGPHAETGLVSQDPDVLAVAWASHAALFPHAAVIVHQGGIGTTAQALRAGCPMLVVPYAHDQPDNARRVTELGVALRLPADQFVASRATPLLARLLAEPAFTVRAAEVARAIRRDDGVREASDACEALLRDR